MSFQYINKVKEAMVHAEALLSALHASRLAYPAVPLTTTGKKLVKAFAYYDHTRPNFLPSHLQVARAGLTDEEAYPLLQGELRLGDFVFRKAGRGTNYRDLHATCCCGQIHQVSGETLVRRFSAPESIYHQPGDRMFPAERSKGDPSEEYSPAGHPPDAEEAIFGEGFYPFPCPHITQVLREALPQAYDIWYRIRDNIRNQARKGNLPEFPPVWLRKDIGFFMFLKHVGLPSREGHVLHRANVRGLYHVSQFSWGEPADISRICQSPAYQDLPGPAQEHLEVLRNRYYSIAARANKHKVLLGWPDAEDFLQNLPHLPGDWTPENYRLTFQDWKVKGFTKENAFWQKTLKARKLQVLGETLHRQAQQNRPAYERMQEALGSRDPGDTLLRQIAMTRTLEWFLRTSREEIVFPLAPDVAVDKAFSPAHCAMRKLMALVRDAEVYYNEEGEVVVRLPKPFEQEI